MSEIKVNKISPRTACGTVTLGDSGDTFTIPAGATITNNGTAVNFGATGSASWVTTVKTSTFTAVAGEGYFVNTTGGVVTVNLPAGTAGAVVAVKDYAGTFDTNACTLVQNGSDKIGGLTDNSTLTTEGIAVTLVFIDSTQGWLVTDSGLQSEAPGPQYIVATGGTPSTVGNFKIHTFTGPGTFCVSNAGNVAGSNTVDYMVVAGGGGGGYYGGGGGAGGFRESSGAASGCYTASPLGSGVSALPVTATGFPITVGGGGTVGAPSDVPGGDGVSSIFSTITSKGGGGGGSGESSCNAGRPGGSGGASAPGSPSGGGTVGSGNTPTVSPPQGKNGGQSHHEPGVYQLGGGGGGAGAVGETVTAPFPGRSTAGIGGAGVTTSINNSAVARAGGGGGGTDNGPRPGGAGGAGGGGAGGSGPGVAGNAGTINTGGGGGAAGSGSVTGGLGGSGIVIIRYKFQN
jgi:hypothetical protein